MKRFLYGWRIIPPVITYFWRCLGAQGSERATHAVEASRRLAAHAEAASRAAAAPNRLDIAQCTLYKGYLSFRSQFSRRRELSFHEEEEAW